MSTTQIPWEKKFIPYEKCEPLEVWECGKNPKIIFTSGIHGDEHQPIEPLQKELTKQIATFSEILVPCVLVPYLYKEALAQGTRKYKDSLGVEHDLNRKFAYTQNGDIPEISEITYPKAKQLLKLLEMYPDLEYIFSFHADNEPLSKQLSLRNKIEDVPNGAYIYDTPWEDNPEITVEKEMQKVRRACTTNKIPILNGWDDINDTALRNYFSRGYAKIPVSRGIDGSFESYITALGRKGQAKIKRSFCFETPGWIEDTKREKYISIVIENFVIPFLKKIKEKDSITTLA